MVNDESTMADALDGVMADYFASGSDQAFAWWAAPVVLARLKEAGYVLATGQDQEDAWKYRDLSDDD